MIKGLREVINIRDLTEEEIANITTPENEGCISDTIENWPTLLETVGSEMAQCADEHVDSIFLRTEEFHVYIQDQHRVAFDVQNMVLNVFTDVRRSKNIQTFEILQCHLHFSVESIDIR